VPNSQTRSDHLRASFTLSLAATILMVAVPLVVIWLSTQVLYFKLPLLSAFLLSLVLSFGCSVVLSRIWERRSKREEISFSELMIWSWYRLNKAERRLEKGLRDTQTAASHDEQVEVLHGLTASLESKDPYTRGHSKRVERHSFKTGVALGLALAEVEELRMSASLHDVGKIRIPNKVLHKPGALSEEERALIEEHPVLGSAMVASIGNQQIVDAVRHHHERWDGGGYPDGKAGEDIPLYARVIAVSDSYDAIRSNRSYRRGASRDQAVEVLTDESGHQFDPDVVEAFLKTLPARGPVVAYLSSLATGPSALWRYLQQLFQQFGSVALAPAIGAAGTAIVVGSTSLFGAGVASPPPPSPLAAGTEASASPGGTPSPGETPTSSPGEASGTRASGGSADPKRDKRSGDAAQKEKKDQKGGGTSGGSTSSGSDGQDGPAPAQEEPTTPGTSAGDGTSGSGTSAGDGTSGSGTSGGDSAEEKGDPNAEGKDCKAGKPQSKGSRRHCG